MDIHCEILGMLELAPEWPVPPVKDPCSLLLFPFCWYHEFVFYARPSLVCDNNPAWEAYFKTYSFYSIITIHKNSGQYVVLLWKNTLFCYLFAVEKVMGEKMPTNPPQTIHRQAIERKRISSSLLQEKDIVYYCAWEVKLFRSRRFTQKHWQKLLTDKSQNSSFIFWELWETFISTQKVKNNECIAVTQKKKCKQW